MLSGIHKQTVHMHKEKLAVLRAFLSPRFCIALSLNDQRFDKNGPTLQYANSKADRSGVERSRVLVEFPHSEIQLRRDTCVA